MIERKAIDIFLSVQKALFLRELSMRFTVSKMGLFWTFFEPFAQIMTFIFIKLVLFGRTSDTFDFAVFLALNFIAFNLFKNILTKAMGAFNANKSLFIYKQVKPIDTILARVFVEIFVTSIIVLIFISIGAYFNFDLNIKNLPLVFLGVIWIMLLGLSLGIFLALGNTFYPSVGKVVSIFLTFLMFGSAVFYTIEMIPTQIQIFLLYNPLTHFMEMIHGFYFYSLDDRFVDYSYMVFWTLIPLYLGLIFYKKLEKSIISI